jgi:hypothetical protein
MGFDRGPRTRHLVVETARAPTPPPLSRMKIDIVNKWLTAIQSIAVIGGVAGAIIGVVVATQTLKQSQQIASATLVLQLRDRLEYKNYLALTTEIQTHDQHYSR